jgi:hypothetical protein
MDGDGLYNPFMVILGMVYYTMCLPHFALLTALWLYVAASIPRISTAQVQCRMAGKQLMEQPLSSPAERSRASQFNG